VNQKVRESDRIVKMDCEKKRERLRRAEHEKASVKDFGKIKILLLWKLKYICEINISSIETFKETFYFLQMDALTKPSRDLKPEVKIQ
jgi:hypothetical protein